MFVSWKRRPYVPLTLLAFLCLTITAHAGSIVTVQLTGAGGAKYGLGANYAYGEYLMPYYLTINGSSPLAVICDDFDHHVTINEQWSASVNTFSNLSGTRFGTADTTQYREAAWIASQITSQSSLSDIAGAQFAIWKLFYAGTPNVPGETSWITAAQTAAANQFPGINFANWEILTPVNPLSPQEYFFPLPEPSVTLDLAFGLVSYVAIWAARRRRQTSELD